MSNELQQEQKVPSPCKLLCRSGESGCEDCKRTYFQIRNWQKFSEQEKKYAWNEILELDYIPETSSQINFIQSLK